MRADRGLVRPWIKGLQSFRCFLHEPVTTDGGDSAEHFSNRQRNAGMKILAAPPFDVVAPTVLADQIRRYQKAVFQIVSNQKPAFPDQGYALFNIAAHRFVIVAAVYERDIEASVLQGRQ